MQRMACEAELGFEIRHEPNVIGDVEERLLVDAVQLVAQHGVAELREMDADLMLSARSRTGAHERDGLAAEFPVDERLHVSAGREPTVCEGARAHLDANARADRRAERHVDRDRRPQRPADECGVLLQHPPLLKRPFEETVGAAFLPEHDDTRGFAVQPMSHAPAVSGAEIAAQHRRQRMTVVSRARMDGQASRLVEHEEVGAPMDDIGVHRHWRFVRGGAADDDRLAGVYAGRGAQGNRRRPSASDVASIDDRLDARTRQPADARGEEAVEPVAAQGVIDGQGNVEPETVGLPRWTVGPRGLLHVAGVYSRRHDIG